MAQSTSKRSSYSSRNRNSNRRRNSNGRSYSGGRNNRGRSGGRNRRKKTVSIDRNLYISKPIDNQKKENEVKYTGVDFMSFNLDNKIIENLAKKNFRTTTEIQEKVIPLILEGQDLLGISSTGSGKTGAFLIPMIQKLLANPNQQLVVVAPTRELAQQISKEAISILKGTALRVALVIGGESMYRQISQLKKNNRIIVATPGRLKDLMNQGHVNLSTYNNVVIDEVDRMLDMGFVNDIKTILSKLDDKKQTLFFSATLDNAVQKTIDSLSSSYTLVKLSANKPKDSVVQSIIDFTHNDEKIDKLKDILNDPNVQKALVFVETKRYADKIDKSLYKNDFKVGVIHGDKRQSNRKKVIDKFKDSKINVLVATNVAARGIDIDDITHVINLDEPQSYDEYIHRIGRTGRNGSTGVAFTFVKRN